MADKVLDNNQVTIVGVVDSEFVYSHEVFGEGFYVVEVIVQRLSNMVDRIPLMISERLIDVTGNYIGRTLEAHGQFRSYNKHEEGRNRLVLSVFVREVEILEGEPGKCETEQYFSGRLYMQTAGVPDDTAWERDCGSAAGGEPALRQIRLPSMHLLGKKCPVCREV